MYLTWIIGDVSMKKIFISTGIIDSKIVGTPFYKVVLNDGEEKMIAASKIKGVIHIGSKGSWYRCISNRLYYYEFEIEK